MLSPTGEATFSYEDVAYTMAFDMRAIAFFEREAGVSIVEALEGLERSRLGERPPKISHIAYLVQAGLQAKHPQVTAEQAMQMMNSPEVQAALGVSISSAMPSADDDVGGLEGNAPAPAKRAKASTGTKSSKARSKRD